MSKQFMDFFESETDEEEQEEQEEKEDEKGRMYNGRWIPSHKFKDDIKYKDGLFNPKINF